MGGEMQADNWFATFVLHSPVQSLWVALWGCCLPKYKGKQGHGPLQLLLYWRYVRVLCADKGVFNLLRAVDVNFCMSIGSD